MNSLCGRGSFAQLQTSGKGKKRLGSIRAGAIALALAASGAFASGAWAQAYQPSDPATAGATPANGQPAGAPMMPNQAQQPGAFRQAPGGYGAQFDDLRNNNSNTQQDFPAAEMGAAVDAYAKAVYWRQAYQRSYDALNMAVDGMRHDFEQSADYRNAQEDIRRAYEDLLNARRAIVAKVSQDPKYQAAISLRDDLTHRIADSRRQDVKIEHLVAMAMVKLGYATTATAMEVVASADDPRVHDARERLMSAGAHEAELERNFQDKVRTDPGMLALRRNMEDARTQNLIAAAVLQGSVDVGNEALNYAYYKHRYDYYYANNNYAGYGGYGYGFNYPYVVTVNGGRGR